MKKQTGVILCKNSCGFVVSTHKVFDVNSQTDTYRLLKDLEKRFPVVEYKTGRDMSSAMAYVNTCSGNNCKGCNHYV